MYNFFKLQKEVASNVISPTLPVYVKSAITLHFQQKE